MYRVLTDPMNTGLGGSSLGGLLTVYLGLKYPNVFGKLAVLSPSVWWNQRAILDIVARASDQSRPPRIWLDVGTKEDTQHGAKRQRLTRFALRTRLEGESGSAFPDYSMLSTMKTPGPGASARSCQFLFPPANRAT